MPLGDDNSHSLSCGIYHAYTGTGLLPSCTCKGSLTISYSFSTIEQRIVNIERKLIEIEDLLKQIKDKHL